MNQLIGTVFTGIITDENEHAYFVQQQGLTFRLGKDEGDRKLGDSVEGFGYYDQKQDLALTTKIPQIRMGNYGFGEVVANRKDLGVFVDIGLPDKEIVVSLDDLPEMRSLWPKKGDRLLLTLKTDTKDRLWGQIADEEEFQARSHPATIEMKNKDISGVAYRLKLVGTYVFTDENYLGFVHPSERFQEPRLGENLKGRVIGVRPDGILNISLKPRAYEVISDDAAMLLTFLNQAKDHKLPFTDKSSPEEIQQTFAISKGQFKRALGSLLKQRLIKQEGGFTILLGQDES